VASLRTPQRKGIAGKGKGLTEAQILAVPDHKSATVFRDYMSAATQLKSIKK
jgi:hypothetical protein